MITQWITGITTTAGALILSTLGVGRMPLTLEEKRAANSIAEARGHRDAQLIMLRLIHDECGIDGDNVKDAIKDISRIMSASKGALLSLGEENDALRAAINAQGRLETIAMLKGMTVEQRFQWERVNHDCPVPLHPDVGINSAGAVINPLTGRYL